MILRLFFCLFTFPAFATVFQMQTVDQQIKESDGIMVGHFLKSKSVHLEDGSIATQMVFKMKKEYGLQSDLFGMDEVIVHYPGGKIGEEITKVEGIPEFVPGENVVLMISSREDRYWGMNLGFGSFKIVNYGKEKMLVNTIFPHNSKVGQIPIAEFERKVRQIKGTNFKVVRSQEYPTERDNSRMPASISEEKNRSIASQTDQVENREEGPQLSSMWLVIFLAALGGWFRLMKHKVAK